MFALRHTLILFATNVACNNTKSITVTATETVDTAESPEPSAEDVNTTEPEPEPESSGCHEGAINVMQVESRMEFEGELSEVQLQVVDFDDVDTSQPDPVSIASDRYLDSHGVAIVGEDGQYVDDAFMWYSDYISTSGANMYAPGPVELDAGGFTTQVHFKDNDCAYGIGIMFIDADFPELGPSGIEVFDSDGVLLGSSPEFSGESGEAVFRGFIALDDQGKVVKGIASSQITNGSVWPMSSCCDGVTLDDLMFSITP